MGEFVNPKLVMQLARQAVACTQEFARDDVGISDVEADGLSVTATIAGPDETAYVGGRFKVKLVVTAADFPRTPPKAFFQTRIFHPNINVGTGDVCVNALQKDWDAKSWSLAHIFKVIRCLLIIPFPESALNQEAAKLFMEDYSEFCEHARMMTRLHASSGGAQRQAHSSRGNGNLLHRAQSAAPSVARTTSTASDGRTLSRQGSVHVDATNHGEGVLSSANNQGQATSTAEGGVVVDESTGLRVVGGAQQSSSSTVVDESTKSGGAQQSSSSTVVEKGGGAGPAASPTRCANYNSSLAAGPYGTNSCSPFLASQNKLGGNKENFENKNMSRIHAGGSGAPPSPAPASQASIASQPTTGGTRTTAKKAKSALRRL
ncbi:unnamed protein product [Amoebophrya sp. A25]|nr:unnamed protein product [Amoebophrya sp. A25]|eukprot:GSA25T00003236001.1